MAENAGRPRVQRLRFVLKLRPAEFVVSASTLPLGQRITRQAAWREPTLCVADYRFRMPMPPALQALPAPTAAATAAFDAPSQSGAANSIIDADGRIAELLPLDGLVYSERQELSEVSRPGSRAAKPRSADLVRLPNARPRQLSPSAQVMCKPKILPIKSVTMERLEQLEEEAAKAAREARTGSKPLPAAQAQQPDSAGLQVVAEEAKEEGDDVAAAAASSAAAAAAATAEASPTAA